jgi:DNA modification methylase
MTKSSRYYYDNEVIKTKTKDPMDDRGSRSNKKRKPTKLISGIRSSGIYPFANKRSVWTVPTRPLRHAHFATFPEDLIEPCILAGCPEGEVVLDMFHGSGTTGRVALRNNRNYIGFELNPEYITIEEKMK